MNQLRIHYLQHVPFEGPGYIETWANSHPHTRSSTPLFEDCHLPSLDAFDWLVIMGGPMGVYEAAKFFWLKKEKEWILSAIEAGKTVIGICLGAQLIAAALGAKVYPNKQKEIGWFPVSLTAAAQTHALFKDFPHSFTVFHWHGDTFDLPNQALHLMQTGACANQAFIYQNKVIGLQFHLEAMPRNLRHMIDHGREELVPGNFVQTGDDILHKADQCNLTNQLLANLLDKLVAAFPLT